MEKDFHKKEEKIELIGNSKKKGKREGKDNTIFYIAVGLILIPGILFIVFV